MNAGPYYPPVPPPGPYQPLPPPLTMINMAANHVELEHQVSIPTDAREALSGPLSAAKPDLEHHLAKHGLSHLDMVHLAQKQFVQGLAHAAPAKPGKPRAVIDKKALTKGIAQKAWSPLWKKAGR